MNFKIFKILVLFKRVSLSYLNRNYVVRGYAFYIFGFFLSTFFGFLGHGIYHILESWTFYKVYSDGNNYKWKIDVKSGLYIFLIEFGKFINN